MSTLTGNTPGTSIEAESTLWGEGIPPTAFLSVRDGMDDRYRVYTVQHGWSTTDMYLEDRAANGPVVALAAGLFAFGGLSMLLCGFFLSTALLYHGSSPQEAATLALAGTGMYSPAASALIADLTTESERSLAYTITAGPMPLEHHEAEITVHDDPGGSRVTWEVTIVPDELAEVFGNIYQSSLDALRADMMFRGR